MGECLCSEPTSDQSHTHTHTHTRETDRMPAARDRFVNSKKAKGLLKGTGSVALLKPEFAKDNRIRCGKTKAGILLYSVLDIAKYAERVAQERQDSALESDAVRAWRLVVDQASEDGNTVAESWANGHLLTAIAESDKDVVGLGAITLE